MFIIFRWKRGLVLSLNSIFKDFYSKNKTGPYVIYKNELTMSFQRLKTYDLKP